MTGVEPGQRIMPPAVLGVHSCICQTYAFKRGAHGEMSVRCESARRRSGSCWCSRSSKSARPSNLVVSASANHSNSDAAEVIDGPRGER